MVNFDSTLGEIMNCPQTVAVLEELSPGISTNPMIKMAYSYTLRFICSIPQLNITKEQAEELEKRINAAGK